MSQREFSKLNQREGLDLMLFLERRVWAREDPPTADKTKVEGSLARVSHYLINQELMSTDVPQLCSSDPF